MVVLQLSRCVTLTCLPSADILFTAVSNLLDQQAQNYFTCPDAAIFSPSQRSHGLVRLKQLQHLNMILEVPRL